MAEDTLQGLMEKHGDKLATRSFLYKIIDATVFKVLTPAIKELRERVTKLENGAGNNQRAVDLEMRIRALEDRPPITYRKMWTHEETYKRGDFVTWGGSMWHCDRQESRGGQPGASSDWSLAVMRGRQGKQGGR